MTAVPGYHGRYLRIDLTRQTAEPVELPADVLRQYIGGSGLGTWLLLAETASLGTYDPLGPDAPVAIVFSPLVGSPLTTSAKFAIVCKSPLTNRVNDSLSSSHFAIAGKKTGYDALVVVGAAEEWTCVLIDSAAGVRFVDARLALGQSSTATAAVLADRYGPGYRIAAIGPAGEQQVRYATVSHEGRHAGRGGTGAVLGAKRLKAIAVRGQQQTQFADPPALTEYSKELSRRSFGPATEKYRELGTVSNLLTFNRLGSLPTRNFQSGRFEEALALAPETMAVGHPRTRASCAACTIGCEHIFQIAPSGDDPATAGANDPAVNDSGTGVRLEYESLFALGPLCGISDPQIVLQAAALCDQLGLDTISAGGTIAFAMECVETGLIDAPDLRFGNGRALLEMLRQIGARSTPLGKLLAQGSRAAAEEIGGAAPDFAPHVKGLEIPGYEPRALQTMALGFAIGSRGADHNRSGAYQVDFSTAVDRMNPGIASVPLALQTEDEAQVMDALILCKFLRGVFEDKLGAMAEMLNLVTGWETDAVELQQVAARVVTAKKWFNIRQGWMPAEDTLPKRFLTEQLPDGASQGAVLSAEQLQMLVRAYNLARGWSPEGTPTATQLNALGIPGIDAKDEIAD